MVELQNAVTLYHQLTPVTYTDDSQVGLGAVIILENTSGKQRQLFMGPASGGLQIPQGTKTLTVITPASPLGASLLHKEVGDEVYVGQQHYEVLHIQ